MQKISIPLIAGLVSGFVFANLVLALTWFLCRRRNMRRAKRRQQELPVEHSIESSASFFKKNAEMDPPPEMDLEALDRYMMEPEELTHSEKLDPYTPPPKLAHRRRQSEKALALMPPPGLIVLPRLTHLAVPSSYKPPRSSGESICDTESMYSTASAPIHLHDQILFCPPPVRNNTDGTMLTPPKPVGRRYPFRMSAAVLPSPMRPLLMASPTSQTFGDEPLTPKAVVDATSGQRASLTMPSPTEASLVLEPSTPKRNSLLSASANGRRPTSEWYYTPKAKRSSIPLPPHLRTTIVEPLRIAKSSPVGRQQALRQVTERPSLSA